MTLTVEDGAGLADADAFVSLDDCTDYCTAQGVSDWTGRTSDPDADEAAIRRATTWLCNSFTWKGSKLNGRSQALAWPRTDVEDADGEEVAEDEVPVEIVQACCLAAAYERANPGGLSPTVTLAERIKRERVGPLETEYQTAAGTSEAERPTLTLVMDMVAGLMSTTTSSLVGRAVRI